MSKIPRKLAVIVIIVALGSIALGMAVSRRTSNESSMVFGSELALPNVCRMQQLVEQKQLSAASRYFWDDLHSLAHALGQSLNKPRQPSYEAFYRAKGNVETDLGTLSPHLSVSVPALEKAVRTAVRELKLAGADVPCDRFTAAFASDLPVAASTAPDAQAATAAALAGSESAS
jgi:hypothetical protein